MKKHCGTSRYSNLIESLACHVYGICSMYDIYIETQLNLNSHSKPLCMGSHTTATSNRVTSVKGIKILCNTTKMSFSPWIPKNKINGSL